jgi:hypothetical protein
VATAAVFLQVCEGVENDGAVIRPYTDSVACLASHESKFKERGLVLRYFADVSSVLSLTSCTDKCAPSVEYGDSSFP